jgi:hypothetical protein
MSKAKPIDAMIQISHWTVVKREFEPGRDEAGIAYSSGTGGGSDRV